MEEIKKLVRQEAEMLQKVDKELIETRDAMIAMRGAFEQFFTKMDSFMAVFGKLLENKDDR